jgi:hypothetical protein
MRQCVPIMEHICIMSYKKCIELDPLTYGIIFACYIIVNSHTYMKMSAG